eukprot:1188776-Prorocentrum_minimum.AAC.4
MVGVLVEVEAANVTGGLTLCKRGGCYRGGWSYRGVRRYSRVKSTPRREPELLRVVLEFVRRMNVTTVPRDLD